MARVVFTSVAREDLRQVRAYIAQDSRVAATGMVQQIRRQVERLGQFPELGRTVPEHDDPLMRELIVAPYRVLYRYQRDLDRVQIIGVVHSSRLLPWIEDVD